MGERRVGVGILLLGGALASRVLGGAGLGPLFVVSWLFALAGFGLLLAERAWRPGAAAGLATFLAFLVLGLAGSGVSIRGVGPLGGVFLAVSAWIVLDHQKVDGLIPPLLLAAFGLTLPALLVSCPRPARA